MIIKDGVAYGQAGAGIVYDSDPLSEYQETMTKMMGGLRAVFRAEAYGGIKVLKTLCSLCSADINCFFLLSEPGCEWAGVLSEASES